MKFIVDNSSDIPVQSGESMPLCYPRPDEMRGLIPAEDDEKKDDGGDNRVSTDNDGDDMTGYKDNNK